jgi:exodeoxyribonuclease VII small subunit
MSSVNNLENLSFEELMNMLKKNLELLEKGDLSLEKSMESYGQGMTFVRLLENKLKEMEGRMEEIMADGSIKELKVEVSDN